MLHITFKIRCYIVCLCVHRSSSLESLHLLLVGFPHSKMAMQSPAYVFPLLCVLSPLGVPIMLKGFSHLRVSSSYLRWWVKLSLESNREFNSTAGISHSEAKNMQVPLMRLPPLKNNTTGLPNHSQDRLTSPVIEINTLKMRDHFDSKKANDKASQARFIWSFSF